MKFGVSSSCLTLILKGSISVFIFQNDLAHPFFFFFFLCGQYSYKVAINMTLKFIQLIYLDILIPKRQSPLAGYQATKAEPNNYIISKSRTISIAATICAPFDTTMDPFHMSQSLELEKIFKMKGVCLEFVCVF